MIIDRVGFDRVDTFFFEGCLWAHVILTWLFDDLNALLTRLGIVP